VSFLLLLLLDDEVVEEEEDGRSGAMLTASDLGDESHRRSQVDSIVDDILYRIMQAAVREGGVRSDVRLLL
jgi:hypothetical protein